MGVVLIIIGAIAIAAAIFQFIPAFVSGGPERSSAYPVVRILVAVVGVAFILVGLKALGVF